MHSAGYEKDQSPAHFEDEGFWSEFGMKQSKRLKSNAIPKIKSTLEGRRTESEPAEKRKKKSRPGAQIREKNEGKPLVNDCVEMEWKCKAKAC